MSGEAKRREVVRHILKRLSPEARKALKEKMREQAEGREEARRKDAE